MIGQTLGHYRIEEQLGAGGMGVVYRARDTKLERDVALKLLPGDAASGEAGAKRLLAEARAASALNHPNVATVYEVGESEGRGYIAMELVEGRTLGECIPADGMPAELVVRYGTRIAAALAHAHDRGVVHRDLKSANVRITPDGQAKVLDFGLAARAKSKEIEEATASLDAGGAAPVGTPHYMAPEVLRGEPIDARSDIWALGVLLQEMATGKRPFGGRSASELIVGIMREPPAPLPGSVPGGLRAIIQRCLAKEPGQRYQRASEVHAALDAISSHATVTPASVEVPAALATLVTGRPWWRRKILWGTLGLAALAGLAVWKGPLVLSIGVTPTSPVGTRTSTGAPASANAEANEYFEKGMHFLTSQVDLPRARRMFERAIELDPLFAEARGWYGFSLLLEVDIGYSNDGVWLYRAEEEIRRTLEIDPKNGHAHTALAALHFYRGRKDLMKDELDKALEINPDDFDAKLWLAGTYYWSNGEYEAARSILQALLARQPLLAPVRANLAMILRDQGDLNGAIRESDKILEQDPQKDPQNPWRAMLARMYLYAGDLPSARRTLEAARTAGQANYDYRMAWATLSAMEGKRAAALRKMDEGVAKYAALNPFFTLYAAEFYAVLGETDKAFEWMDRAVRGGDERAEWFQRDPLLANIRSHPRFKQILDSIQFRRQQRKP
jgi:tetratricopeptide (TPR) repeat protein/predicted Ser/Thr protein kinase